MANEEVLASIEAIIGLQGMVRLPDALREKFLNMPQIPDEIAKPLLDLNLTEGKVGARKLLKSIRVLKRFQRQAAEWEAKLPAAEVKTD